MALYVAISPIALTAQRRQYCCGPDRGLRRRGPVRLDSERRVHQHLRLQLGRLALADARPHRRRAHIDPASASAFASASAQPSTSSRTGTASKLVPGFVAGALVAIPLLCV